MKVIGPLYWEPWSFSEDGDSDANDLLHQIMGWYLSGLFPFQFQGQESGVPVTVLGIEGVGVVSYCTCGGWNAL